MIVAKTVRYVYAKQLLHCPPGRKLAEPKFYNKKEADPFGTRQTKVSVSALVGNRDEDTG